MSGPDHESLFKRWLSEHSGIVLKVARAYTLTAADGQDLAQEILLQLWRSLARFEGRASESTWIYRVALNTALGWKRDERRRQARFQAIAVEDVCVTPLSMRYRRNQSRQIDYWHRLRQNRLHRQAIRPGQVVMRHRI